MIGSGHYRIAPASDVKVGDTLRHPEGHLEVTAVKVSGEHGRVVKLTGTLADDGREISWTKFADRLVEVECS